MGTTIGQKKILFFESAVMELIVEHGKASGGAAVQTLVWMEGLHAFGHQVFLACTAEDTRAIKPEYSWIQQVPLFHSNRGIKKIRWASYRIPKIFKAIQQVRPDYLYESVPFWGSYILSAICKILQVKHIVRISNDNLLDERLKNTASKSHQFFLFLGLRWSDIIFTQNNFQHAKLSERFPNKPIVQIYNPIKIAHDYMKPKQEMKGYIAWVANFRYQKNLQLLFKIASILPHEQFKIAGVPTSHYDQESEEFVTRLKALPNVEFLGQVARSEIFMLYASAKFLLNTSRYEGFSNTFLEAMSTGTPILTSSLVNPDQLIDRNELGHVYTDESDLKYFLDTLSESEYLELSENCISYVGEKHAYKKLTGVLLEKLSQLNK
ncbi:glycosyltransferase family 4 protein [Mongoliitalea daihaiensis]|uniref:glycosyltransferase family 4 protein n=1 Tax=Mongoliitalea daihaiensis TaxID=2782006 RepID=UPI001F39DD1B|nr:glycosyltransferase [Mongoliitalea daihaiensis]UJP64899.1 glycosyltransferase [Mongoliitalea daihaiensis]